jgi:N12 class adenine-specific DNA methylase
MVFEISEDIRFLVLAEASELELEQIRITLTKQVKNAKFNPRVQKGYWDGYYCYFYKDRFVPIGLWRELVDMAKKFNYQIYFKGLTDIFDNEINIEEFTKWSNDFFDGFKMEGYTGLREYQIETAFRILKFRKCSAELATSAGKTLISFLTIAYMLKKDLAKKILYIVPNVSLVNQAESDFYIFNNKNQLKLKIEPIYSGQKPKKDSNIIIGTYQSLVKKKEEYFNEFDAVIVDECLHPDTLITMSDNSLKKISNIKEGDIVKTFNIKTKLIENNAVEYVYKNNSINEDMYEIEMEDNSIIKITGNHKVQLNTGIWKRVDELENTDEILSISNY